MEIHSLSIWHLLCFLFSLDWLRPIGPSFFLELLSTTARLWNGSTWGKAFLDFRLKLAASTKVIKVGKWVLQDRICLLHHLFGEVTLKICSRTPNLQIWLLELDLSELRAYSELRELHSTKGYTENHGDTVFVCDCHGRNWSGFKWKDKWAPWFACGHPRLLPMKDIFWGSDS